MGSQQTIKPTSGLIRVPLNYPTEPTPGKLESLLLNNEYAIYHRYSPYYEYDSGLVDKILGFGSKQPYIYTYIDESKKGLSGLRRYESRLFPVGSAPRDVIRVTKYIASGKGVVFLGKQFLLQTFNVFNETRLYNPTSPIVAAGMTLAVGTIRPQRNIDLTGGLGGLARSLIGNTIPDLFGKPTVSPPPGTVPDSLPDLNLEGGKGLLRGQTAKKAASILQGRWPTTKQKGGIGGFSFKNFIKNLGESIFGNYLPKNQNNVKVRSDENAYSLMIGGANERFGYQGNSKSFAFNQLWLAGGNGEKTIRKGIKNLTAARVYNLPDGKTSETTPATTRVNGGYIEGVGLTGFDIQESKDQNKPGIKYGDSIGVDISTEYDASSIMVDYSKYVETRNEYVTKRIKKVDIEKTNETLKKVIDKIVKADIYQVNSTDDSKVLPTGNNTDPSKNGYNRIFKTKKKTDSSPINYADGLLKEYKEKNIRMVDNSITTDRINKSLKLPGAGNFDAINTLVVLPGERRSNPKQINFSALPGWNKWDPYKDDQIAFFFYDIVNDKYIPFRATVKGIAESSQVSWEELSFIGRADKLYSYGGFSRNLTFSFGVYINSIIELGPTWKRINYLMSLVKPSRYTKSEVGKSGKSLLYNRFMIPPMVLLTIGDLYKKQPILINSLSMTVPDDAIWETLNEENAPDKTWSYLLDYIKSDKIYDEKQFGQFPREVQINVNSYLLEKERAIIGAANFGHAPHTDDYYATDIDSEPMMHRALVEYQRESDGAGMPEVVPLYGPGLR